MKKQPNKWTCYPTAASILTDIPIQRIIETIGHDGSGVCEDGPFGKRAFHTHEMAIALFKLGWAMTAIPAAMKMEGYPNLDELSDFLEWYAERVIVCVQTNHNTVHALAWFPDKNELYDPLTGLKVKWTGQRIESFEMLTRYGP